MCSSGVSSSRAADSSSSSVPLVESSVEMPWRCAELDAVEDLRVEQRLAQPDQHHVLGGCAGLRAPGDRRRRRSCPPWAACGSRAGTSGSRGCTWRWSRRCTPRAGRARCPGASGSPTAVWPDSRLAWVEKRPIFFHSSEGRSCVPRRRGIILKSVLERIRALNDAPVRTGRSTFSTGRR